MKRWEFDSLAQAAACISSWFLGKLSEQQRFKEYLDSAIGEVFYDIEDDTVSSNNDEESTSDENPSFPDTSSSRGVICSFKAPPADYGEDESKTDVSHATPLNGITDDYGVDVSSKERQKSQGEDMLNFSETDEAENAVEATEYHDVLILFRFKDRDLPFK